MATHIMASDKTIFARHIPSRKNNISLSPAQPTAPIVHRQRVSTAVHDVFIENNWTNNFITFRVGYALRRFLNTKTLYDAGFRDCSRYRTTEYGYKYTQRVNLEIFFETGQSSKFKKQSRRPRRELKNGRGTLHLPPTYLRSARNRVSRTRATVCRQFLITRRNVCSKQIRGNERLKASTKQYHIITILHRQSRSWIKFSEEV